MGDVGNSRAEEINYEPVGMGGRNYGWRVFEGTLEFLTDPPPAYTPLTAPIYDYYRDGDAGASVSGGYVYRGTKLGCEYWGRYFFGDWVRRSIESLGLEIDPATGEASVTDVIDHTEDLGGTNSLGAVVSMGENAEGELFVLSFDGNRALLIEPENAIWITQITARSFLTNVPLMQELPSTKMSDRQHAGHDRVLISCDEDREYIDRSCVAHAAAAV